MIHVGDCLDVMRTLAADSVDSIVTDPPYGIRFMGKAWDGADIEARAAQNARKGTTRDDGYDRKPEAAAAAGSYDLSPKGMRAFQEFSAEWGREALRVLKPGAHLVSFASPRTYHRMVCGLEEAGFEIRDSLMWLFGSGFPKNKDLGDGWGTALKPGYEPIVLARKPFEGSATKCHAEHGTAGLNIEACRIPTTESLDGGAYGEPGERTVSPSLNPSGMNRAGATTGREFEQPAGRWPANVLHDGSDEVLAAFPSAPGQQATASSSSRKTQNVYGAMARGSGGAAPRFELDKSAARFFYCPKASREDRNDGVENPGPQLKYGTLLSHVKAATLSGNTHPTVKPTELMRWLCRLITPPGGTILDPFMGSGSTGRGARAEGFEFIGIEVDPDYTAIARRRIDAVQPGFALGVPHV